MILIAIAWIYVVLMVAVVEAIGDGGTVLGAVFTFLLYGVLPLGIVTYLMLSPARRRARKATEPQGSPDGVTGFDPDHGGHAASDTVAAERKET